MYLYAFLIHQILGIDPILGYKNTLVRQNSTVTRFYISRTIVSWRKAAVPLLCNHFQYNVIYREEEREMLPLCIDLGVGVVPWSPLARGFLAGNRNRDKEGPTTRAKTDTLAQEYYYNPEDFDVLDRVINLAEDHEATPAQIALAWLLNKPGITAPVVGASKMSHLEQAVAAVEIDLSEQEMAFLEEPYKPHAILGHE